MAKAESRINADTIEQAQIRSGQMPSGFTGIGSARGRQRPSLPDKVLFERTPSYGCCGSFLEHALISLSQNIEVAQALVKIHTQINLVFGFQPLAELPGFSTNSLLDSLP